MDIECVDEYMKEKTDTEGVNNSVMFSSSHSISKKQTFFVTGGYFPRSVNSKY